MGKVQKSVQKKERDPRGLKKGQTHAGSFVKDDPRRGNGKKKAAREAGASMAADMERAYTTPESPEEQPGVRAARRLFHEDYPKFMAMYLKAKELAGEVEVDRPAPEVAAAATPVITEGIVGPKEESVIELAHRLLREWELEDGRAWRAV